MKTLELKHLAAYYPYGIKTLRMFNETDVTLFSADKIEDYTYWFIEKTKSTNNGPRLKMLLTPLSEIDGTDYFKELNNAYDYPDFGHFYRSVLSGHAPYELVTFLISEHYDVFDLIDNGLAIDLNTIKQIN